MQKNQPITKSTHLLKPLVLAVSSAIMVACSTHNQTVPAQRTTTVVQPAQMPSTSNPQNTNQNSSDWAEPGPSLPNDTSLPASVLDAEFLDAETLDMLEDFLQATDMSMVEGDDLAVQRYGNLWDRVRRGYRLEEIYNARIEAQKSWFYTRQSYLNKLTARASRYLHYAVTEAERRGIPSELALLPIIESSYDPAATSHAQAAGLWQFIPSTGKIYGLNQNSNYDGRRDVIESTRAAYDFLTSLYNQFGSWELALAAYNAGPGRVSRAIRANEAEGLPVDYWSLRLPTETMNYVPRFLAVAQIVKEPQVYGISLPAIANHNHFRAVTVNYGVGLDEVSMVTGVPVSELKLLNPALLNLKVESVGPNRIVIPDSLPQDLDERLRALAGYGFTGDYLATAPAQSNNYVVPKYDTPYTSTQPTQESTPAVLSTTTNQPTAHNILIQESALSEEERMFIAAQVEMEAKERVAANAPTDDSTAVNSLQTNQSVSNNRSEKTNPAAAATLSLSQNRTQPASTQGQPRTNNTTNNTKAKKADGQAKPAAKPTPAKPESYTVRTGDSLTSVATANGLTVSQLASYNNLATNTHIRVGQRLWLVAGKVKPQNQNKNTQAPKTNPSPATQATHKVQAGENLTHIARSYGVTLQALAAENNLSVTDGVLIGQVLKLPANAKVDVGTASNTANTGKANSKTKTTQSDQKNKASATPGYDHKVRAGESLTTLSRQAGISVSELAGLNGLSANAQLRVGQTIKMPKTTTSYTVKPGDGLISLARKFGISPEELARMNNLSPNANLQIGQKLIVPNR